MVRPPPDGTFSACATACNVASDGEICPLSIFDSIPAEMPAEADRSEAVSSVARRSLRICAPSACSSVRSVTGPAPELVW